jgi:uracil-DNA glycosylase
LTTFRELTERARACTLCAGALPHDPRPIFQVGARAPILLVGQAPGRRVHDTGIPWNDPSGDRLREWLGVDRATFYDPRCFAIVPMGLCYPGTVRGKGDRPPMAVCGPTWQPPFLAWLSPRLRLQLFIGQYAIAYHLPSEAKRPVAAIVAHTPQLLECGLAALPHPSPRNRRWLRERPWFESELVPRLREAVAAALSAAHSSSRVATETPDKR